MKEVTRIVAFMSCFVGDVKSLYEKATVPTKPDVPMTPKTKRTRVHIERDRRELQEEMENRAALRDHKVPGYFESELGKAFLLSQVFEPTVLMGILIVNKHFLSTYIIPNSLRLLLLKIKTVCYITIRCYALLMRA